MDFPEPEHTQAMQRFATAVKLFREHMITPSYSVREQRIYGDNQYNAFDPVTLDNIDRFLVIARHRDDWLVLCYDTITAVERAIADHSHGEALWVLDLDQGKSLAWTVHVVLEL